MELFQGWKRLVSVHENLGNVVTKISQKVFVWRSTNFLKIKILLTWMNNVHKTILGLPCCALSHCYKFFEMVAFFGPIQGMYTRIILRHITMSSAFFLSIYELKCLLNEDVYQIITLITPSGVVHHFPTFLPSRQTSFWRFSIKH